MGSNNEYEDEEYSCEVCEETISIDSYMDIDDIVSCEECGTDYLIESRDPLLLEIMDDDEEDDGIDYDDDYS